MSILVTLCELIAHFLKINASTTLEKVRNVSRFYTEEVIGVRGWINKMKC